MRACRRSLRPCLAPPIAPHRRGLITLGALSHELEARVRAVAAADLCGRAPVGHDDVRGEVVLAADQRRADAVGVDGDALPFECLDLVDGEAAGGDYADPLEAVVVERVA